ncbi:hypothetical protein U1Q18_003958 [Sarracenia purpurea var. burkii]
MASTAGEITHDFPPFFRVYKDGRIERLMVSNFVPPGVDPQTGVEFKDVLISPETGLKIRIFLPKIDGQDQKLPLLVHYHGGGFTVGSALGSTTLRFIADLASEARAITVSVEYRLAPEHPLPIAHHDSFAALQWIATHSKGEGPDPWLNQHADFGRVFVTGESAGANIAHYVAARASASGLEGLRVSGLIMIHPYFADDKFDELIKFIYPESTSTEDDPILNPKSDPDLAKLGCSKVAVFVVGKDRLKPRGEAYYETLKTSGWDGKIELIGEEEEDHCFHLFNPSSERVGPFVKSLASFINLD